MTRGFRYSRVRTVVGIAVVALVGAWLLRGWIGGRGRTELSPEALEFQFHQALQAQQWSTAKSLLDQLPPVMAASANVAILRAELQGSEGKVDDAVITLAGIPESDPLAARSRLLIGQIEKGRDHARKSEAAFLDAIRLDPALSQARRELALLYGIQGRRAELKTQFEALAKLETMDLNGVFLWTNSNEEIVYSISNRPILERFVAADPDDRWSRLALAEVFVRSDEAEFAEKANEILKPLPESDIEALGIRVRAALKRSRIDEARAMLAREPAEHPVLCRLRGQLAIKEREAARGAEQLQIALRLDSTNREVALGLATAYRLLGDSKQEQTYRELANRLRTLDDLIREQFQNFVEGKKDPTMPRRLGAACEAVGRLDVARAWYEIAIGLDPLDAKVQKALHALKASREGS